MDFLAGLFLDTLYGAIDEFLKRLAEILEICVADSWSSSFNDLGLLAWFGVIVDALVDVVGF